MKGRTKCNVLKELRRQIAKENGVPYETSECHYEGEDCRGTCPKCDAELKALTESIIRKAGSKVAIASLGVGVMASLTACTGTDVKPTSAPIVESSVSGETAVETLSGDVCYVEPEVETSSTEETPLEGGITVSPESNETDDGIDIPLDGDVEFFDDSLTGLVAPPGEGPEDLE